MAPEGCQKRDVSLDFAANAVLREVAKKKKGGRLHVQTHGDRR